MQKNNLKETILDSFKGDQKVLGIVELSPDGVALVSLESMNPIIVYDLSKWKEGMFSTPVKFGPLAYLCEETWHPNHKFEVPHRDIALKAAPKLLFPKGTYLWHETPLEVYRAP